MHGTKFERMTLAGLAVAGLVVLCGAASEPARAQFVNPVPPPPPPVFNPSSPNVVPQPAPVPVSPRPPGGGVYSSPSFVPSDVIPRRTTHHRIHRKPEQQPETPTAEEPAAPAVHRASHRTRITIWRRRHVISYRPPLGYSRYCYWQRYWDGYWAPWCSW
jgi:hypothetical protein